jgi:5-methylthioadenosine/S-adenosylhomocysteine deaminase
MSFHMSPAKLDPDGFIAEFGQRPMVHLAELGVLADDVA